MPEEEFEHYLSLMTRLLRLSPAQREEVAAELRDHLEQRLDDLMASGLTREAAVRVALAEFGDSNELAQHLTQATGVGKRRRIMRFTIGTVAVFTIGLALATAFWPENDFAPAPLRNLSPRRLIALPAGGAASKAPPARNIIRGGDEGPRGLGAGPDGGMMMRGEVFNPPTMKRFMVRLQHLPSADIGHTLQSHFSPSHVQVVSEAVSNTVLISTAPDLADEVLKTLTELDKPAQPLVVEVTVLELTTPDKTEIDLNQFRGPSDAVRTRLDNLQKGDQVKRLMRFQLSTVNNQMADIRQEGFQGGSTSVSCIPRIADPSRSVTMTLTIDDLQRATEGKPGETRRPDSKATCRTTLTIPNGQSVVAGQLQQFSGRIVFIVSVKFDPTAN